MDPDHELQLQHAPSLPHSTDSDSTDSDSDSDSDAEIYASARSYLLRIVVPSIVFPGMLLFSSIRDRNHVIDQPNDHLISLTMNAISFFMLIWVAVPYYPICFRCIKACKNGRYTIDNIETIIIAVTGCYNCGILVHSIWLDWLKYLALDTR